MFFDLISVDDFATFVFRAIGILTVLSTLYDVYTWKLKLKPNDNLKIFSLTANFKQLMTINRSESVINCIDGIKAIAAMLIVAGHRKNTKQFDYSSWSPLGQFMMSINSAFTYNVVTFFACGGILVAQSMLRALDRGKFNLFKAYVNRYLRLAPVMVLLVMYFLTSWSAGNGGLGYFKGVCSQQWKKALLFYQNYNGNDICFHHTWYLSTDLQLFILSPIFVYILRRFHRKGISAVMLVVILLQFYCFLKLTYKPQPDWWYNYVETHFRLAEFLVGIIAGYVMYNTSISNEIERKMKQNKVLLISCWSLAIGFIVFHVFLFTKLSLSPTFVNIYFATSRELWAVSVCWIVFACHRLKSGGFIRSFLSHPFWQPLSKLTLNIYLLHMVFLMYTEELTTSSYGFLWLMHLHVGDIFMSVGAAFFAYILIEAPSGRIIGMMCKTKIKRKVGGENQVLLVNAQKSTSNFSTDKIILNKIFNN